MQVSIIVPVLNESAVLPVLTRQLVLMASQGCEVLIVDGGSQDGSATLCERAGLRVLSSLPGRARQMNLGAAHATGEVLLFLHADTQLPQGAIVTIHRTLLKTARVWGRFDVEIEGRHSMLRAISFFMNLRSRCTGIATGDQAIFSTRDAFYAVGGFPDQPLMEDVELCARLRALSRPVCIRLRARTSGRRWESRGVWRTIVLMWWLRWAYWRGAPAQQLANRYQH